ncbi:unnamed protein product [Ceratitis capitata]|uniref:(Mediterranean fruit fly) hypothetical protein n=1 Tax=Ceratitis capitata TaxID=7213 RepID=A0A811UT29_CERCA|nr:unnamed protein product [Ceratitis capitata]
METWSVVLLNSYDEWTKLCILDQELPEARKCFLLTARSAADISVLRHYCVNSSTILATRRSKNGCTDSQQMRHTFRAKPRLMEQIMADLPVERVQAPSSTILATRRSKNGCTDSQQMRHIILCQAQVDGADHGGFTGRTSTSC